METIELLNQYSIAPTQLRIAIIELLKSAAKPLSYDDILKNIDANKTSIYRNMELFLKHGLISKSELGHKGYYELFTHSRAYFVCNVCHEMHDINMPELIGEGQVMSAVFNGICKGCEQ